jgi:hypothetical protein
MDAAQVFANLYKEIFIKTIKFKSYPHLNEIIK